MTKAKDFKKQQALDIIGKHVKVDKKDTFVLSGKTFKIVKWNNRKSIELLPVLGNLLLVPTAMALDPTNISEEKIADSLGDLLGMLFHRLGELEVTELVDELLTAVKETDGTDVTMDSFEDIADIMLAIAKVIGAHYSCLFMKAGSADLFNMLQMTSAANSQ